MAQKNFKLNDVIKVTYQAAGAVSGLTATMEIYDETGSQDLVNFPAVTMTEIGTSGRYTGSFTPDAVGEWTVTISDTAGGKVVRQYSVGTYNLDDVGGGIAGLNDISVAQVNTEVTASLTGYDAATSGDVTTTETAIRGADSDDLKSLSDQVDGLQSPPMIG